MKPVQPHIEAGMNAADETKTIFEARIAYIADQRCPSRKANAEQLVNTVAELASQGLSIDLITPRSWRSLHRSRAQRYNALLDFYKAADGFGLAELLHFPSWSFRLDRLTHGLLAPLYSTIARHDIIYTRNWVAAFAALALRKQLVFETYRVHSASAADPVTHLARLSHSRQLLGMIAHSEPSRRSLLRAGAVDGKTSTIPNGFNPDVLEPRLGKAQARRLLGWPQDEKIVCYAGRIDVSKGAISILDLAEATPDLIYVFVGYSEHRRDDWILRAAARRRLRNIRWLPWVTTTEQPKFLYAADALVIPPTKNPLMKYGRTVLPLKTFHYMAAGRPILAPRLPDIETVLTDNSAALVEPDNVEAAANTLHRLFESADWRNSIARQAEIDSRAFTWHNRARAIIAFLNERMGAVPTRTLSRSSPDAIQIRTGS